MAAENRDEGGGTSLKINIGKEIDAALGDVIRGLLMKPARAIGDLASDTIGMLGDRIKRKREFNAQLGLEEVRNKLEADNVDMKDITPPKEEELHLLVNGLSLSDDECVRDMWAGLFAKALKPNSGVTAERPFISVLQSLSPMDAKIIDFLAFVINTDSDLRQNATKFMPKDFRNITHEESEKMKEVQKANRELQNKAIQTIEDKAEEYGLKSLSDPSWVDNLMRQGVVERTPMQPPYSGSLRVRSLDKREILHAFEHLNKHVEYMEQFAKRNSLPPARLFSEGAFGPQIQLEVQLSPFGRRFADACGLL